MNKKISSELAVGIILILAVVIGGIFWISKDNSVEQKNNSTIKSLEENTQEEQAPAKSNSSNNNEESSGWNRYKATTLNEIITNESDHLANDKEKKDDVSVYNSKATSNPYKVRLTYKNEYRNTSSKKMNFLKSWGYSFGIDDKNIDLYNQEALFVENGKEYWMPIQSQLIPFLKKEVVIGGLADVFIMWPGAYLESSEFNWVFIINDFTVVN